MSLSGDVVAKMSWRKLRPPLAASDQSLLPLSSAPHLVFALRRSLRVDVPGEQGRARRAILNLVRGQGAG